MLTIEGTYKDGKVLLSEMPSELAESKVLVMFLNGQQIDLKERGIGKQQAHDLRNRLSSITEDWNMPEMDIYDVD